MDSTVISQFYKRLTYVLTLPTFSSRALGRADIANDQLLLIVWTMSSTQGALAEVAYKSLFKQRLSALGPQSLRGYNPIHTASKVSLRHEPY